LVIRARAMAITGGKSDQTVPCNIKGTPFNKNVMNREDTVHDNLLVFSRDSAPHCCDSPPDLFRRPRHTENRNFRYPSAATPFTVLSFRNLPDRY